MGREPRSFEPNGVCHFTARGSDRRPLFHDDRDRRTLLIQLGGVVEDYDWSVLAWCLMTNHYHLLMSAPAGKAVSNGMRALNGGYARMYNRRYGRDAHVFRNRFSATPVETDEHLVAAARYVVLNPVRAGMCGLPEEWPWSSYRATVGLAPVPAYFDVDRLLGLLDHDRETAVERYRSLVRNAFVTVSDTVTERSHLARVAS
jgi:REP element-mobilizing transposase RayT